jgi:predicted RNA-binding Zn-ribbon protein involved in translation (DUF1610 family)
MSRYRIERECWSDNTFNGYEDRPYWRITLSGGNEYGLTDDGKLWSITNLLITDHTKVEIQKVITECKLNIKLENNSPFICGSCGEHVERYTYNEETDTDECDECKLNIVLQ